MIDAGWWELGEGGGWIVSLIVFVLGLGGDGEIDGRGTKGRV